MLQCIMLGFEKVPLLRIAHYIAFAAAGVADPHEARDQFSLLVTVGA